MQASSYPPHKHPTPCQFPAGQTPPYPHPPFGGGWDPTDPYTLFCTSGEVPLMTAVDSYPSPGHSFLLASLRQIILTRASSWAALSLGSGCAAWAFIAASTHLSTSLAHPDRSIISIAAKSIGNFIESPLWISIISAAGWEVGFCESPKGGLVGGCADRAVVELTARETGRSRQIRRRSVLKFLRRAKLPRDNSSS